MKLKLKTSELVSIILAVAGIIMAIAVLVAPKHVGDFEHASKQVSRVLSSRLTSLDEYSQSALNGDCTKWMDFDSLPDDMVIYRYCSDTLQSWVNMFHVGNDDISHKVLVPFISSNPRFNIVSPLLDVTDSLSYINIGDAWFLAWSYQNEDCMVISGLEIASTDMRPGGRHRQRRESVFRMRVNPELHLSEEFSVTTLDSDGGVAVVVDDQPLFKIVCENMSASTSQVDVLLVWIALFLYLLGVTLFLICRKTLKSFWICFPAAFAAICAMYFWGRSVQVEYEIFSPILYAGDDILFSLGAVLLADLLIFVLSLFLYIVRKERAQSMKTRKSKLLWASMTCALSIAILAYVHFSLTSIIHNSGINLELYKVGDVNVFSIIVYISYILVLSGVPLILSVLPLSFDGMGWISGHRRIWRALYSLGVALYLVATTGLLGFERERNRTDVWANRLALDRDINFEMRLRTVEQRIADDMMISALAMLDNPNAIRNSLMDTYLPRIAREQYTINVYVYNEDGANSAAEFNELVNGGQPIADNSHFLFVDKGFARSYYVGVFMYFANNGSEMSRVLIKIDPRFSGEDRGYGGIFGFGSPGTFALPEGYTFARYSGHEMSTCSGSYAYPTYLDGDLYVSSYNTNSSIRRTAGYTHFVNVVSENEAVVISRKSISIMSYVVATVMVGILVFIILSLLFFFSGNRHVFGNGYFKSRITGVLIVSLILTLVAVSSVSVIFVYNRDQANLSDIMSDKISSISKMMDNGTREYANLSSADYSELMALLERVGTSTASDLTLFGPDGRIYVSTTPMIFDRMMMGGRLNGMAYENLFYNHQRYFIQAEHIGRRNFHTLYAPVTGKDGRMIGALASPYYTEARYDFESDAILHSMTIFSLFILFLFISTLIVLAVIDRIFKPLSEMGVKMNSADIEKLEYISYDRNDEISSLVQAYNQMVTELSESSRKLAQAERDKAWSGMARQVAHEIKNPLTPMKLQLQRVMRLKQKGDPAWQDRFDEASKVLLDHIDILTETANEFSSFAKLYTEEATPINLDKVLHEEISMFDNKDNIVFDYYGLKDVVVEGPKPQLTRVFVNLINNSVQAIGDAPDGHIIVSLRNSCEDGFYDIVFEDNGPGVSPENIEKLFTPNFTTKNGGSGLGLAISRSILEKCGASVSYSKSFTLGGACFTIKYPKTV